MSGTACLLLEFVAGGQLEIRLQIRQRKLLSAVSDSSQQVVIIMLEIQQCIAVRCIFIALHCALALDYYTQSTWI